MTALPSEEVAAAAILTGYQRSSLDTRNRIVATVVALWRSLRSWRDPDIDEFVRQVVPIVAGGQQQVAALTAAYLREQRLQATGSVGSRRVPRPADVTGAAVRNGVEPETVYHRAGVQVWADLADGKPLAEAVEAGLRRAVVSAEIDLQLAKTHTAQDIVENDQETTGYLRVLNGEKNCALCILASTQRYHKKDLLPIHPGCDCGVAPLYGDEGLEHVQDRDLIESVHKAIEDRFGSAGRGGRLVDYRKLLLVQDHGEYGPVLTWASHAFTGPQALASGLDLTGLPRN